MQEPRSRRKGQRPYSALVDTGTRESRKAKAESLVPGLAEAGVVAVATTFVDNSGITRVKSVPLDRLPHLAAWGVGASTSFDYFRFDDWLAAPPDGRAPVGDLRVLPDLERLVPPGGAAWLGLGAGRTLRPGRAAAPSVRSAASAAPDRRAGRPGPAGAGRVRDRVGALRRRAADDFVPAAVGPGYGMTRLIAVSDYARDLLEALAAEGVAVEQFHPEYATGQLELSVAAGTPVETADTSVLVRSTIRAVGQRHGFRTSFSPKVEVEGVGNGGHVHLSVWRDGHNLMAGGAGPFGLTEDGAAFAAGILEHLPGLLAIGAPSVASYLRLIPSHWAGVFACWGLENREAALRMVTGSEGSARWAANLEVKCIDLTANPYLLLAGLLAAGLAGLEADAPLPDPIDVDPGGAGVGRARGARHPAAAQLARARLPTPWPPTICCGTGSEPTWWTRCSPYAAPRSSEFADSSAEDIVRAFRWAH